MIFQSKNASLQSESTNNQIVMESHTNRSKSRGKPASKKSQNVCRAKPRTKRRTPFHVALPRPGLAHQLSITQLSEVISLLRKGYSIRDVAKLSGKGVSTVQRVKRLLKVQSPQ